MGASLLVGCYCCTLYILHRKINWRTKAISKWGGKSNENCKLSSHQL